MGVVAASAGDRGRREGDGVVQRLCKEREKTGRDLNMSLSKLSYLAKEILSFYKSLLSFLKTDRL